MLLKEAKHKYKVLLKTVFTVFQNLQWELCDTVDSLLFVGYQFSWFSWVQVNHEFKCSTNTLIK